MQGYGVIVGLTLLVPFVLLLTAAIVD